MAFVLPKSFRSLFTLAMLVGCADPIGAETLRVGTDEMCPAVCRSESGRPGYQIDVLNAIFRPLGYELSVEIAAWPRVLQGLYEGRYDIVPSIMDVPGRPLIISKLPIRRLREVLVFRRDDPRATSDISQWMNLRVGIRSGYFVPEALYNYLQANAGRGLVQSVTPRNWSGENFVKLRMNRVDVIYDELESLTFHNGPRQIADEASVFDVATSDQFVGFWTGRKDGPELALRFDRGMERLISSGDLDRIRAEYRLEPFSSVPNLPLPPTAKEFRWPSDIGK